MKIRKIVTLRDLTVDLEARRVIRDGEEIQLGRLSFDFLEALIRRAPAALSTDDIVQMVWLGDAISDETIKQRVSLLRRALGQEPGREYVETLRGYGYRLAVQPEGAEANRSTDTTSGFGFGRLSRAVLLALAVIVLVLLITVLATAVRQVKRMGHRGDAQPEQALSEVLDESDLAARAPGTS